VHGLSGTGEVASLGHGDEVPELLELHFNSLWLLK
jgi:hypothetical protein